MRRIIPVLLTGLLAVASLTACGSDDPFATYCGQVKDQQGAIAGAVAHGGQAGLLAALPSFEKLKADSPDDIADDWALIVMRLQLLQTALDAAGVDPSTYDPAKPPAGLTSDQSDSISAAAIGLLTGQLAGALTAVQQEARDVCQTPLSLS